MRPFWQCVVLGSVLCVSIVGTHAQDKLAATLLIGKDGVAVMKHRLTLANVRQMFAVERELLKLMKEIPDFDRRTTEVERPRGNDDVDGWVKVYEGIPELAHILDRHRISAREYLLTKWAAMSAEMMVEGFSDEDFRRLEDDEIGKELLMIPALQFWRKMDPDLKAEAAEWKKAREQMVRH